MDVQQIAEKLFNFCKEKYPDLKWNFDPENNIIQCPVFPDELIIDVFLDSPLKRISCEVYYIGGFELWVNPDDRNNNRSYENKIVFDYIRKSKSLDFDNSRESRKLMLDIFNYIINEIQD